jgi:hypothetical protein
VISIQVCTSIVFNAISIGVIFQRLSRVQKRARTIVFSDRAVIRRIRGRLFFMFQLSELRKHQLVEAHVRVYCIRHERARVMEQESDLRRKHRRSSADFMETEDDEDSSRERGESPAPQIETCYFQSHNVRLQHPDDELGAFLLMGPGPNVVVHRIDEWSPLMPPAVCKIRD